jgi:type IV pilus assembly protein PilE
MRIHHPPLRRVAPGFTLIELMITIAVIGILLRIAYPAYMQQMQKSRRVQAKTALLDLASREERYFGTNNQYTSSGPALGYSGALPQAINISGTAYYTLSVTVPSSSPTTFTASATRISTTPQSTDKCGDYGINNTGTQTVAGGSLTASSCW